MDPFLSACTGIDALVHAIEAFVSTGHGPLTDPHALEAMRLINGNLVQMIARSEEHTSELQSLMRISYAVFCLKKKKKTHQTLTKSQYVINHMMQTKRQATSPHNSNISKKQRSISI